MLSGFEHTGNWPFNPDVFTDIDFAPASVTDIDFSTDDITVAVPDAPAQSDSMISPTGSQSPEVSEQIVTSQTPNLSSPAREIAGVNRAAESDPSTSYISPREIINIPKASPRKTKKIRRKKGKTQIYTLTPVRNEVADKEANKAQKKCAGSRSKTLSAKKNFLKRKNPRSNQY